MWKLKSLIVLGLVTLIAAPALAGTYVGGGTVVARTQLGTLVDNGGVVCDGVNGDGVGGGCLLFPQEGPGGHGRNFVQVIDNSALYNVAFQVCIDNNGDGLCGGPLAASGVCPDQLFFSHDDAGRFFNPLGPLPFGFLRGCEGNGGFPGYVVLLCEGAHEVRGSAHTHGVSVGSISPTNFGSGYGDFCGGGASGGETGISEVDTVAKGYVIV